MSEATTQERRSLALPLSLKALAEARGLKSRGPSKLTDRIEVYVTTLYDGDTEQSARFRSYLEAAYNVDAVEGAVRVDRLQAALLIREMATQSDDPAVSQVKLEDLRRALEIVARRHGFAVSQNREAAERPAGE